MRAFLRWLLSTAAGTYLAVFFIVDEELVPSAGPLLLVASIVALLGLAITSTPVKRRLPSYRLRRRHGGLVLDHTPAEIPSATRLWQETEEFAAEIYDYAHTATPTTLQDVDLDEERMKAIRSGDEQAAEEAHRNYMEETSDAATEGASL